MEMIEEEDAKNFEPNETSDVQSGRKFDDDSDEKVGNQGEFHKNLPSFVSRSKSKLQITPNTLYLSIQTFQSTI